MGKPTGFMEYDRTDNTVIPALERIETYDEFHTPLSEDERRTQGARCMDCGVPFCQSAMSLSGRVVGCPLHNLIPEWNEEVYHGHVGHALSRLLKTNCFPEFTSRVCPALCEKACICGLNDSPVTIRDNEYHIIETAFSTGLMTPRIPDMKSGKKVAVIGSGPAGLAAADMLNHRGHHVDVFERDDHIGGLLMYGIPNMKLEKSVIDRRQALMEEEGVVFHVNTNVGADVPAQDILDGYDAVILACGAKEARSLNGIDMSVKGTAFAVDYLTGSTKSLLSGKAPKITAKGKRVVIVGGGDTGNDCVGTAIRQGAKSVVQIEMMPQLPHQRSTSNPWPEWPMVEKTDYGQEEAIAVFGEDPRRYETTVTGLVQKRGKVAGCEVARVSFADGQMTIAEESKEILDCDLFIVAAGFTGCDSYVPDAFGLTRTDRHVIVTDDNYHTRADKVFACGDMRKGQSLVVWAIAEGRACAAAADAYLMGYTTMI